MTQAVQIDKMLRDLGHTDTRNFDFHCTATGTTASSTWNQAPWASSSPTAMMPAFASCSSLPCRTAPSSCSNSPVKLDPLAAPTSAVAPCSLPATKIAVISSPSAAPSAATCCTAQCPAWPVTQIFIPLPVSPSRDMVSQLDSSGPPNAHAPNFPLPIPVFLTKI